MSLKMKKKSPNFFIGTTILIFFLPAFSLKEFTGDEVYIDELQLEKFEAERMRDFEVEMNEPYAAHNKLSSTGGLIVGRRKSKWLDSIPKMNLMLDPVINFKMKQKVKFFGACMTVGVDYLSDLAHWRLHYSMEDDIVGGRFSLRGAELGWAKSWMWSLGMTEENTAKFKMRLGLNLLTFRFNGRLRFRTEPISPFDIGEGISCAGKLPIPGVIPILRALPSRLEYRLRINAPRQEKEVRNTIRDANIGLSTGLHNIDVSLDELNFCLEWDQQPTVLDVGLIRRGLVPSNGVKNVDNSFFNM